MTGSPVLPLRPLTVGELLDAAAALLRSRWRELLGLSFAFALVEQVFMTWLRMATIERVRPQYVGDLWGDGRLLWLWIVLGLGTEIFIISLLSAPATATAAATIRGEDVSRLPLLTISGRQWSRALVFAVILALVGGIAAALCYVPWFAVYALFGLSIPALMCDRLPPVRAFFRSPRLFRRSGTRTAGVRLIAYTGWLLIRLTITCGAIAVLNSDYIDFSTVLHDYFLILLGLCYLVVNTVCYAMLACVDAVTYFEARVRTEGLDIAIARERSRGKPVSLAAPEAR